MARTAQTNIKIRNNGVALGTGGFNTIDLIGLTGADEGNGVVGITGSSGGTLATEIPVGTVDGSNTVFTVSNTPVYISIDGVNKFVNVGYTYSAGTITIIDNAPPTNTIYSLHN